ncbi:MAG: phosphate/phosphite/phosphonate ABC transporter substrate-binding protein [Candidatus Thiodiazotropha sp.]|jgi:phosphonate transport system substrate-binding protein
MLESPKLPIFFFCLSLCLLLVACDKTATPTYQPTFSKAPPITETVYLFGVHPLHNPQRLYEVFGPLMDYLSEQTPGVRFKLVASRNYAAYDEKLYAGKFHFSLPNPYQTINAIDKGYRVFAKMGDDENFRGIILVRRDSGITQVSDLKGKAVSYPAPTALAATMMPQYYLQTNGVDVKQDLDNRYVGSQESSVMNVYLQQTSAAATWPPPWLALVKERPELKNELQVIWETDPLINNGLVVLPEVPADTVRQVHDLIVNLHTHEEGRQILKPMELSRFESATNSSYDVVRDFITSFSRQVRELNESG